MKGCESAAGRCRRSVTATSYSSALKSQGELGKMCCWNTALMFCQALQGKDLTLHGRVIFQSFQKIFFLLKISILNDLFFGILSSVPEIPAITSLYCVVSPLNYEINHVFLNILKFYIPWYLCSCNLSLVFVSLLYLRLKRRRRISQTWRWDRSLGCSGVGAS